MNKYNSELRQKYYSKTYGKYVSARTIVTSQNNTIDICAYERKHSGSPFYTLITDGISDISLSSDKNHNYIELLMYVCDLDETYFDILEFIASFIDIDKPCIKANETIASPYKWWKELSLLQDFLVTEPIIETDRNCTFKINNSIVNIYWVIPITRMERDFKNKHGVNSLLDLFDEKNTPFVLNKKRKPIVHNA